MGISTCNSDKKSTKNRKKMIKLKKDAGIIRNRKKSIQEKLTIQLEEINQNVLVKEGRLKKYRQRVKPYRRNRTFQNNEIKFYQQLGRRLQQNIPTTGCRRYPTILGLKYGNKKNITKKLNG